LSHSANNASRTRAPVFLCPTEVSRQLHFATPTGGDGADSEKRRGSVWIGKAPGTNPGYVGKSTLSHEIAPEHSEPVDFELKSTADGRTAAR